MLGPSSASNSSQSTSDTDPWVASQSLSPGNVTSRRQDDSTQPLVRACQKARQRSEASVEPTAIWTCPSQSSTCLNSGRGPSWCSGTSRVEGAASCTVGNVATATFVVLGLAAGNLVCLTLVPPPPPIPNSPMDLLLVSRLRATFDTLPITRLLRSQPDVWREWEAYDDATADRKAHRLTSGPMSGGRGLAVQHVFWNEQESKAVSVVFFGAGLSGWPGVTHGGAIATVMDESLGRVALRVFPAKTGGSTDLMG